MGELVLLCIEGVLTVSSLLSPRSRAAPSRLFPLLGPARRPPARLPWGGLFPLFFSGALAPLSPPSPLAPLRVPFGAPLLPGPVPVLSLAWVWDRHLYDEAQTNWSAMVRNHGGSSHVFGEVLTRVSCLFLAKPPSIIALRLVAERLVTLPSAPQVFPHDDDWRADY